MNNLEIGQTWISENDPHESFKIYDIIIQEWDNHPTNVLYCWQRINHTLFIKFVAAKKGITVTEFEESNKNTYPYAFAGESKKSNLVNKIKKFNMELINNENIKSK
jgi:hypothetical protein